MVSIYTFCDKTLVGKYPNLTTSFLCENLYKLNLKIDICQVNPFNYDYSSLTLRNNKIYFLLTQKTNTHLNEVLASLTDCKCLENQTLKDVVTNIYNQQNIPLDKNAELYWTIPEKAIAITNPCGKTQGYYINVNNSVIFVLPNNYNEIKKIYYDCISGYLNDKYSIDYISETYKLFGLSENNIFEILKENIKNKDKVYISVFSKGLDSDIIIKAKRNNEKFEVYRRDVFTKLQKYIYSVNCLSIDEQLNNTIEKFNHKIAILGDITLCNVLQCINQNNLQKFCHTQCFPNIHCLSAFLGKELQNINEEVVYDMAVKTLQNSSCDVVICFIKSNENGVTYFAIGNKNKIDIYKNQFVGNELEILENFSFSAKYYIIKKLESNEYKTI